ncbi:L,D-transpeptidase family protein [Stratiformator vulcanicus]|uniref:L,D-transpeptidase YkuD n=1 Tax=Stratiformator vulcanicus TaxID=2527980 RepID=A0A517QXM1_9PLAN|nr:LysM peptidoglycan-binding domain-containing protein [Stratiformator vulcanicus]QDT36347.1 Putative L,D-transpeptidase YkuD [Stratiformator vulcanicus]
MASRLRSDRPYDAFIWTVALLAFGGLTMWHFEMWPTGWNPEHAIEVTDLNGEGTEAVEDLLPESELDVPGTLVNNDFDESAHEATNNNQNSDVDLAVFEQSEPPQQAEPRFPEELNLRDQVAALPQRVPPQWPPTEPARTAEIDGPDRAVRSQAGAVIPASSVRNEGVDDGWPAQKGATDAFAIKSFHPDDQHVLPPTTSANLGRTDEDFSSEQLASPRQLSQWLQIADAKLAEGNLRDANRLFSRALWGSERPSGELLEKIDRTAAKLFFRLSDRYQADHVVKAGESIEQIARKYDVSWQYLARLNRLNSFKLTPGTKLKVVTGPFGATIDQSDFVLTLHLGKERQYVRRYPTGFGQDAPIPSGRYLVAGRVINPDYRGPDGTMVAGGSAANPLGGFRIKLTDATGRLSSVSIHGTNDANLVGRPSGPGTIRLRNEDAAELFDMLSDGSVITVQP